jgi:hypothetical protein
MIQPSSTIIERAKERSTQIPRSKTCYFYFDFNNGNQQTVKQLLCCLLGQILPESSSCLEALRSLYYECGQGTSSPDPDSLIACLHKAFGSFYDIFIVIDALDECTTIDELMKFLGTAIRWELPSLHLLLTSRKTAEIDEALTTIVRASAALTPDDIDPDIQRYISRVLRDEKDFKRWDPKSLAEIEDVLIERASGMYVPPPAIEIVCDYALILPYQVSLGQLPIRVTEMLPAISTLEESIAKFAKNAR